MIGYSKKQEREWFKEMTRKYYPDLYLKNYGFDTAILTQERTTMEPTIAKIDMKVMKAEAKRMKVAYHSVMSKQQLIRALECCKANTPEATKELNELSAKVKAEYMAKNGDRLKKLVQKKAE
jgi:hypothetical protein